MVWYDIYDLRRISMAIFSREQLHDARLQARAKRQEEIDQKHAEIAQLKSEGGDTEALEREQEKH